MKKYKQIEKLRTEILDDPNFSGKFESEEINTLIFADLVFINGFLNLQAKILNKYGVPLALKNVAELMDKIIDDKDVKELLKIINEMLHM